MFDQLNSRLIIRGGIHAETGLHIGAGAISLDPSATDSPVIRDAAGRPFIPGSSFKGAFRAHLEKLLRGLNSPRLKPAVCDPLADPCLPDKEPKSKSDRGRENNETLAKLKKRLKDETGEDGAKYNERLTQEIKKLSCPICLLFGSNALAARVMIKDLFIDPAWWTGRFELRDGVGIDRDTETARHGIKYDFEVIPATTRFQLELTLENGDDVAFGLLGIGLRELEQKRVTLGGKTTRGLGNIKLELDEIEMIGDPKAGEYSGEGSADLLDYFLTGKGKFLKRLEAQKYLGAKIETFRTDVLKLPPKAN